MKILKHIHIEHWLDEHNSKLYPFKKKINELITELNIANNHYRRVRAEELINGKIIMAKPIEDEYHFDFTPCRIEAKGDIVDFKWSNGYSVRERLSTYSGWIITDDSEVTIGSGSYVKPWPLARKKWWKRIFN